MPGEPTGEDAGAWYAIAEHIHDRELARAACTAVLDVVRPAAVRVRIDAYTDHRKTVPVDVDRVEATLHRIGRSQHRRDPGMNIRLDPRSDDQWELLIRYALWSINVDLYDADDHALANFHDCGHSVSAHLSVAQADDDLARRLADRLTVVPFTPG